MYANQYAGQPQQQQVFLPYSTTQMQAPWANLNINAMPLPHLQLNPNYPGELTQMIPLIAYTAAATVQNQAQANPLRTFMYNQVAQNGFMNDDFAALITACVEYLMLRIAQRQFANMEQAVAQGVPQMVEMIAAMNVAVYAGLWEQLPPVVQQGASRLIDMFRGVSAETRQMLAQNSMAPQVQPGYNAGGYRQPAAWQQPQAPMSSWGQTPRPGQNNAGLFSQGAPAAPAQSPGLAARATSQEIPAYLLNQPFAQKKAVAQNAPPPVQAPAPAPAPAAPPEPAAPVVAVGQRVKPESGLLVWSSSPLEPYPPAYRPSQHALVYELTPEGYVKAMLEETDAMNYDQHAVSASFGKAPRNLPLKDAADVLGRIMEDVSTIGDHAKMPGVQTQGLPGDEEALVEVNAHVKSEELAELNEETAWLTVQHARLRDSKEGETPDVFRCYVLLSEALVSAVDENVAVRDFGSSRTFAELREKLVGSVGEVSPALFRLINNRMTRVINRVMAQNLSIPNSVARITSFVEDIQELPGYLSERFGESVSEALLKNQRRHIQRALLRLDDDYVTVLNESFFDMSRECVTKPQVTYVSSYCTFTQLSALSYELDLALHDKDASALTQQTTPEMYALVRQLFEDSERLVGERPAMVGFDRHLIRTMDGRVLEASRGYLGDRAFYLLSLVS